MKISKQKLDEIIKEEFLKLLEAEIDHPEDSVINLKNASTSSSPSAYPQNVDTRPHGRRGPSVRAGSQGERGFERRAKKPTLASAETLRSVPAVDVPVDVPEDQGGRRTGEERRKKPRYTGQDRRDRSRRDPMTTRDTQATIEPVSGPDPDAPKKKPSRWQRLKQSKLGKGLGRLAAPLAVAAAGYEGYDVADKGLSDEGFDIPLTPQGPLSFIPGTEQAIETAYDYYGIPTSAHVPGTGQLPDVGDEGIDFSPREIGSGLKQGWKELTGQQRGDEKSLYRRWLDSAKQEEGIQRDHLQESKENDRLLILAGVKRKIK